MFSVGRRKAEQVSCWKSVMVTKKQVIRNILYLSIWEVNSATEE